MKKYMSFVWTILLLPTAFAEDLSSPVGKWKTIDDETKKPKSVVEITEASGKLTGKIIKLFREPNEDQNPKCDKCDGERRDAPIIGMTILWGLTKERQKWTGGKILDPKNGKTYDSYVKVEEEGKKLTVRGFIGASFLGRSQTWERQPN